jgi:Big-like domain-containing protein/flagellar hook capping protein FlgD/putative Ig domain-containing protein
MRRPWKSSARSLLVSFAISLAVLGSGPAWAQNAPPVITAPATITAQEGVFFSVTITATSQDPSATVTLTGPSPFCGISFSSSPGVGHATGTLSGTPGFTCAGSFSVPITASDGVSSSSLTIALTVQNTDRAPVVTVPASMNTAENALLSFTATATDPDGDAIASFTASSSPPTTGSTFTSGAGSTSGTFSWTPAFSQAGSYTVTFTAANALSGSAATAVTVTDVDRAPVLFAGPASRSVAEGANLNFPVTASDPDGDAIASLTASSSPATTGSTFTVNATNTSGTFDWTTPAGSSGAYVVTFTASNALTRSFATTITVGDRPPVVTAPATVTIPENAPESFTVTAADPDGEPITSLTSASSPPTPGSSFTANATNTSGTFSWTPSFTAAGAYTVTFTASNALSGTAQTTILVCNGCDRAPVVTAPATATFSVNTAGSIPVSASDPDGNAITSLTSSSSPATTGSSFSTNATNTAGTFGWSPGIAQMGTYNITFTAVNSLSASASTALTVCGCERPPVVTAPATAAFQEGVAGSIVVGAADPDGDPIASLTSSSSPATTGSTFTAGAGNTSGTFNWTPSFTQAGTYTVTFTASNALSGSAATAITIGGDRAPVVTAPAVVSSPNFTPVSFTVTATDPDGDALTSLTAFAQPATTGSIFTAGAGNTSGTFQWSPTSTQAGAYSVTFTATSSGAGVLQGSAITQITVGTTMPARVFTTNSNKAIKLNSGKPQWCAHVEPVGGSFQIADIQLGSVVLRSPGTGSVSEIPAITGKTNVQGDVDNNGIDDGEFCFAKANLQLLFSNLNGRNTVDVTIAGRLISGLFFEGTLSVDVNAGGGGNPAASITPNPLNPSGVLSFGTVRSGVVRVRLFDSGGRLVRTVLDTALPAGPHEVPLEAKNAGGSPLASGVYFFRVEAPDDVMTGRFVVAK